MSSPGYYAIIPASVRYDVKLNPNAKLLYGEITALCGAQGFCWAKNDYFAVLYNKSNETISRWVSQLQKRGYIDVAINKLEGNKRRITLSSTLLTKTSIPIDKNVNTLLTKTSIPIDKNVKSYNRINNTSNNTSLIFREKASEFLEVNFQSRYETEFLMRFKKQFQSEASFNDFIEDFDLTWDGKDYPKNLFGELVRYAKNKLKYVKEKDNSSNAVVADAGKIIWSK